MHSIPKDPHPSYASSHPLDYRKDGPVNIISYNKQIGQSDFRLHFILPNVKLGKRQRLQQLLNQIRARVSKVGTPQSVQVIQRRKNFLDIAVGLRFDYQAVNYLHNQNKKILLMDSGSEFYEIMPLVCEKFYGFMQYIGKPAKYKMCTKENLYLERKNGEMRFRQRKESGRKDERDSMQKEWEREVEMIGERMIFKERSRDRNRGTSKDKSNVSFSSGVSPINRSRDSYSSTPALSHHSLPQTRSPHKTSIRKNQLRVILAGIPLSLQYKQIDYQLYNQGYLVQKMLWIKKKDIDLLDIKLSQSGSYQKIEREGVKLAGQSVMVVCIPEYDSDKEMIEKIMDCQVRVEFKGVCDRDIVVECLGKYGSLVDCVEDRDNEKVYYATFAKKQTVKTVLSARNQAFQAFLDKDVFPIRRRMEGLMSRKREQKDGNRDRDSNRDSIRDSNREMRNSYQGERDSYREREKERESYRGNERERQRERERERQPTNSVHSKQRQRQRQREWERQRQRQRQREIGRQRDKDRERERNPDRDREPHRFNFPPSDRSQQRYH